MAFEIGYKGTLADGRGQVNASIYRYDYEGYQDQIDTYDTAQNRSVDTVTNAGDAVNQGFEIEVNWLLGDYLTVGGNYSYTDTYDGADCDDPDGSSRLGPPEQETKAAKLTYMLLNKVK